MKKKRLAVEQIVAVLKQTEMGAGGERDPADRHFGGDVLSLEEAGLQSD